MTEPDGTTFLMDSPVVDGARENDIRPGYAGELDGKIERLESALEEREAD